MKKKNLIFAAALSAVMALTVTASPNAFAVKETKPAVTEAEETEKAKTPEFKKLNKFSSRNCGMPIAMNSDGTVCCWCGAEGGTEFFTVDGEGKVLNSYRVDDYTEGDLVIGVSSAWARAVDDGFIIMYTKGAANNIMSGNKGSVLVKLDKDMNEVSRCEIGKCKAFDSNGEKIVILKGKSIYLSDMDGSNKKLVYTADGENGVEKADYAAISDTHIGFGGKGGSAHDARYYTGVIDLETGEVTVKRQDREIWGVSAAADGTLVWSASWAHRVKTGDTEYYSDREYYLFDGEKFDTFTAEDTYEQLIIDSDGQYITYGFIARQGKVTFKLYKDGAVAGSYVFSITDDGYGVVLADGGVIAVSTVVYPEGEDGRWHAYTPGDPIEESEPYPININTVSYKM